MAQLETLEHVAGDMVDLWGESDEEVRQRWCRVAGVMRDASSTDQLAECLQLVFLVAAVSGYCGRGTGGEGTLRAFLPLSSVEAILRPEPTLGAYPKRQSMAELRAGLHPEFPLTSERTARELKRASKSPKTVPNGAELAELRVFESSGVFEAFHAFKAEARELAARVDALEARFPAWPRRSAPRRRDPTKSRARPP